MNQNIIKQIETLSVNAVYCLVSKEHKKVYIAEGNILKSLTRLLDSFKQGMNKDIQDDMDKLELQVLDVSDDTEYRRLRVGYWMIQFKDYHQYRNRVPVTLTAKVSYRVLDGAGYAFYVELYDKKRRRRVVGVFERESDAVGHLNAYYPKGEYIGRVVYADNELTKEYLKRNQVVRIYGVK